MSLKVVCVLVLVAASYGLPTNTSSDKATDLDLKAKTIDSPVISGEMFNQVNEKALKVFPESHKSESDDLMIQARGCRVITYRRKSGNVYSFKIC